MTISSRRLCSFSAVLALSIWAAHQNQEDLISQSNLVDGGCSRMKKPLKILQRLTVLFYLGLFPIALRMKEALSCRWFKMRVVHDRNVLLHPMMARYEWPPF